MRTGIAVLLAVLAHAASADYVPGSQVTKDTFRDVDLCNAFIDGLVEELTVRYRAEIDPYNFANRTSNLGILGKLHLKLYNGHVTGLSNLRRKGDCYIVINREGHKVNVTLGTEQLDLSVTAEAKLSMVEKVLHVRGRTDLTRSVLMLNVRQDTGRPYLEDLMALDQGNVEYSVDTETFMDRFFNLIVDHVSFFWKNSLALAIENKIESLFDEMLSND